MQPSSGETLSLAHEGLVVRPPRRWRLRIAVAVAAALWLFLPVALTNTYDVHVVNIIGITIILVIGLNVVWGFCGQISLCQAAFFGIGAYISAICSTALALPVPVSMLLGVAGAALGGAILGVPSLRLSGFYLAIVTLGFGEIFNNLVFNLQHITNGQGGIIGIPPLGVGGFRLKGEHQAFYAVWTATALAIAFSVILKRTNVGRIFQTVRDNEALAQATGANVFGLKVLAFVVSAVHGGLGGVIYAHMTGFISPESFSLPRSLGLFTMLLVGGIGTIGGPILGAAALILVEEYLRFLQDYLVLVYGCLIVACSVYFRGGLVRLGDTRVVARGRQWFSGS